jgi:thiol-disulfide isomerase/thioredoxin
MLIRPALISLLLTAAAGAPRPQSPADFAIHTLSGGLIRPSQFKGKVVVIEFLLTTCPHCQNTTTILKKLQTEYGPGQLQVLGCTAEDMAPARLNGFISQFAPGYPIGFADLKATSSYLQHDPALLLQVPQLVFLDKSGVKRATYVGNQPFFKDEENNIRRQIDALLRDAPTSSSSTRSHGHQ